jgi:hypothetical protein
MNKTILVAVALVTALGTISNYAYAQSTSGGPLEELGQMLGFGENTTLPSTITDTPIPMLGTNDEVSDNSTSTTNNQTGITTYENPTLGIAFEHPANWTIEDQSRLFQSVQDAQVVVGNPPLPDTTDASGEFSTEIYNSEAYNTASKTGFRVRITDVEKVLDPDTLQLTPIPISALCTAWENSLDERTFETGTEYTDAYWLSYNAGKLIPITVGNQTGCRINSVTLHDGAQEKFDIDMLVVKDGKFYVVTFSTAPDAVPTMGPLGERMIKSFRFLQ